MEVRFDLHIHSERSPDGRMSLDEIVARARARRDCRVLPCAIMTAP